MTTVYLLYHVDDDDEYEDDATLIGVFSSEGKAKEVIPRLAVQPGFKDYPEGFKIYDRELDHVDWTEGFLRL